VSGPRPNGARGSSTDFSPCLVPGETVVDVSRFRQAKLSIRKALEQLSFSRLRDVRTIKTLLPAQPSALAAARFDHISDVATGRLAPALGAGACVRDSRSSRTGGRTTG